MDTGLIEWVQKTIRRSDLNLSINEYDLKEFIRTHHPDYEAKLKTIIAIFKAYQMIDNIIVDDVNAETLRTLLFNKDATIESHEYFGYLLTVEKGFNPIDFFSKISDGNDFWATYHIFVCAFQVAPKCDIGLLLKCISNCIEITNSDLMQGSFFSNFNMYFKVHLDQNYELLDYLMEHPEHPALNFSAGLIQNIYEQDPKSANDYIDFMLSSKLLSLVSMACFVCGSLFLLYPKELFSRCNTLVKLLDEQTYDSCIANILHFFVYIVTSEEIDSNDSDFLFPIIKQHVTHNNIISKAITQTIALRDKFNYSMMDVIDLIFLQAVIEDTPNQTNPYDHLLNALLGKSAFEKVYSLLKHNYLQNIGKEKNYSLQDKFNITYYKLTDQYCEELIDKIYMELISREERKITYAMQFMHYHNFGEKALGSPLPKWLSNKDCYLLAQVFTAYCFDAKLVCSIAIKLLDNFSDINEEYITFYLDEICENYWETSKRVASEYINSNDVQKRIITRIIDYVDFKQKKYIHLLKVKDFQPSNHRSYLYSLYRNEQTQEIMKDAETKSIFAQLIARQTIKYGKRFAVIRENNGEMHYEEKDFGKLEHSYPLPAKYLKDPFAHFYLRQVILKGEQLYEVDS